MASGLNTDSEDTSRSSEDFPKKMRKSAKSEDFPNNIRKSAKSEDFQKKMKKSAESKGTGKKSVEKTGKHRQSLSKLKDQDPEFYEFLKNEDAKLLEFSGSDDGDESDASNVQSEDDDSADDSEDEKLDNKKKTSGKRKSDALEELDEIPSSDDDDEGIYHKMPGELEVASNSEDEDDIDEDENDSEDNKMNKKKSKQKKKTGTLVTMNHINSWSKELQTKPTVGVIKDVISAFKAAVQRTGSEGEVIKYRVEGNSVYNGIIRMCLSHMAQCLYKVMGLPALTDLQKPILPTKQNKKWRELRVDVKMYATDLLQLLGELAEASMMNVILKHIHRLTAFYACFPKLSKTMMKKMISLWSVGEETTRVVAFLCINRLVLVSQNTLLEPCMKQMYMAYVKNTKFTSPSTLPLINFMQHSLVEIFALDFMMTYQFAFIYIRQLAIHLRNAITVKKKENCQAVYNWQYVHCLELWVRLLSATYPNEALEPLIYPLTQTIIGTIKLLPTPRYYPLRFHCVRCLNTLSATTRTFIPILPFLLEVFEQTDFNRKHKSVSLKPFNFACILKLSKAQLTEKAFRDGLIDQLYELLIEQFHIHSHSIGFPELALPAVLQLREFLKKCKVANYCKQIKQIVEKVEENSKFITHRRRHATFSLSDVKALESWERQCKESGTPIGKYYKTWRRLRDQELQHEIAGKEQIVGLDDIPVIQRPKGPLKATPKEKDEFADLFKSDSEESDDEMRFLPKSERPIKKQKTSHGETSSDDQEYSDFDSDELEILARSGDEDDESDEDDIDDDDDADNDNEKNDTSDEDVNDEDDIDENDDDDDDDDDKADVVEDFQMSDSD